MLPTHYSRYFPAFLTLVVGIIYFSALGGGPFWDDFNFIFQYLPITEGNSPFTFFDPHSDYAKSWPIPYACFWTMYRLFGQNFYLYKLVNIGLHLINSLLLYRLSKKLSFRYPALISCLFALHPLQVEAVSWMFQLGTLLSFSFFLLSFLSFLKIKETGKKSYFALSFTLFSLSLYSKASCLLLSSLYLVPYFYRKWKSVKENRGKHHPFDFGFVSFLLIIVVSLVVTINGLKENRPMEQKHGEHYALTALGQKTLTVNPLKNSEDLDSLTKSFLGKITLMANTYTFYIKKFFVPGAQMFIYPKLAYAPSKSFLEFFLLISLFLLTIFFLSRHSRFSTMAYGLGWYGLAIFPISGITYVSFMKFSFVADRWAYVGVAGLAIVFADILYRITSFFKNTKTSQLILTFFSLPILIFLSIKAFSYIRIFNHPLLNYTHTIEHNPEAPMPYLLLGVKLYNEGKMDLAEQIILKAYFKWPRNFEILQTLFEIYTRNKKDNEAMDVLAQMAELYHLSGEAQTAFSLASQVHQKRPNNLTNRRVLIEIINQKKLPWSVIKPLATELYKEKVQEVAY